ncbi:hypothetical protein ACFL6X_05960 [Candidatus Latescibacterota bacterium]
MRRNTVLFAALALVVVLSGVANAHLFGPNGEGNPYFAPAVPAAYVPSYDGDLGDWAWYPPAYTFTPDWFIAIGNFNEAEQAVPKDDFDVIIYGPAWIPSENKVTFAVQKVDDIFSTRSDNPQDSWDEDVIQFAIDADHGGEVRAPTDGLVAREYQQAFFTPKLGGSLGIYGAEDLAWSMAAPHAFFGMLPEIVEGTTGTFTVEVQLSIWDHMDAAGADASTLHQLAAGEIVGLSVEIIDTEEGVVEFPDVEFDFGSVSIGGEVLPDYYLMSEEETLPLIPTAVQSESWGRVKRALVQ